MDRSHVERGPLPRWRGDIRAFPERDLHRWSSGRWHHGHHDGRLGWWWIVGGLWYFYPGPVHPYPDPYVPPAMMVEPPPGRFWYYCPDPPGYYPYVPACRVPWQPIPAAP
ncbi:MAG: hypothetical protein HY778_13740 [Betaproteobacteria bacterium]|nr:hypothetical protein [Betaproteobacteria bacterium]